MKPTTLNMQEAETWKRTKVHFAVIGALMLFALAILTQENTFHGMTRELLKLERSRRDLVEERDRLTLTVEQYRHPARIRTLATEHYGLAVPAPDNVQDVPAAPPSRREPGLEAREREAARP